MKRVFGLDAPGLPSQPPIITIGTFDGVHLGHQDVLREACQWAQAKSTQSCVITFDIHPRAALPDHAPPAMITSLEHRLILFEQLGIDQTLILPFDPDLCAMTAEAFVQQVLVKTLRCQGVVFGFDARFGSDRKGDGALLDRMADTLSFTVRHVPPHHLNEITISSTAIREAVRAGHLGQAAAMLGRPVSVLGTIVHGLGLGSELGFPTINLDPHHELHPPRGVYFTRARCGDTTWDSITNIGHRPTLGAQSTDDVLIETHLLNYHGDLYGQVAEVMFLSKHRDEKAFEGHAQLAKQVHIDISSARDYFAKTPGA